MPQRQRRGARQKEKDHELERRLKVNEEQDTEIEALAAIFAGMLSTDMDDIDIDHDYPRAFSIKVVPHPAVPENNHSYIDLVVRLSREYPANLPQFIFRTSKGLSKSELGYLMTKIKLQAETLLNEPMIYDIVTSIQEELRLHNQPETSLHEEMIQHQMKEVLETKKIERQRQNQDLLEQQELQNRLAQLKATETLTSAAEHELRKGWMESKQVESAQNVPALSEKDNLENVQLLLTYLLRMQSKDSSLATLASSGLVPTQMTTMPFSSLSSHVAEVTSSFDLSLPKVSPRYTLPSVENQASVLPSDANNSRSRYMTDFMEIETIGKGSFGRVSKVQNRLDGLFYAMKVIEMRMENESDFHRILREVTALSRLSHPYVLRYYQAFIECVSDSVDAPPRTLDQRDLDIAFDGATRVDMTPGSIDWSLSLHSDSLYENNLELGPFQLDMTDFAIASSKSNPNVASSSRRARYELYIQTEFCAQTLRETIANEARRIDPEQNWRRFRQILEGLAHIHSQGICHRDLKPGNIFVHPCGDVRIGDLGLATHFQLSEAVQRLSPSSSLQIAELGDHTTAIGTLLYTAPEMMHTGASSRYYSKVDMFSLGIVFFEMWYPFSTGHERVTVLQKLRHRPGPVLPEGFQEAHPRQSQIIRWLLQDDPQKRPTALELLQSNLLPPKLEDEYMKDALRTISNPNTPFYHRLLSELFNSIRPMPIEALPTPLSSTKTIPSNLYLASACRHYVIEAVRSAFESHSGLERLGKFVHRSACTSTNDGQILLMDREGRLLDLRRDLRSNLIRSTDSGRHFQIGCVFRAGAAGQSIPKHIIQADFDIVGPDADPTYADAEIVSFQLALLDMFPILGEARLQLGHVALTSAVLDICRVPTAIRPTFLAFVKEIQSSSGPQVDLVRQYLSGYAASDVNVNHLIAILAYRGGTPADAIVHLRNHLIHNRMGIKALDELQSIITAALLFGVSMDRIEISPLLTVSPNQYSGFISKAIVLSKGVKSCLVIGGKYDLISPSDKCGVGLSLAIEQLWDMLAEAESQERRPNKTIMAHCTDVFVASIGSDEVFEERLRIVGELYGTGVNVAFHPSKSATLEEQHEMATLRNAQWLLTIKDKYVQTSVRMRQLDSDKRQEFDLAWDEVVKFFYGSKHVPYRRR